MCLSTVYKGNTADPENKLAEYVACIDIEDGAIRFTDVIGEALAVRGSLTHIDLAKGIIFVDQA